jgi:chitin disaccharide deacetylase
MRIILNADDFGYCADTVRATIDCFERAALTSATIMVNMPASDAAIAFARANSHFSFGVHLTYVSDGVERPITPASELPALASRSGLFLPSNVVRKRALLGRLPAAQIERETSAQLERLRDSGVRISHVDSHGHLHKFKPFREALMRVLPRFGVSRVRTVQNVYLRRPLRSPTYWFGGLWRQRLRSAFATTDHFYMSASAGDAEWPAQLLNIVQGGSLEVGVHPGIAEEWRSRERQAIVEFSELARVQGHALIGWREL